MVRVTMAWCRHLAFRNHDPTENLDRDRSKAIPARSSSPARRSRSAAVHDENQELEGGLRACGRPFAFTAPRMPRSWPGRLHQTDELPKDALKMTEYSKTRLSQVGLTLAVCAVAFTPIGEAPSRYMASCPKPCRRRRPGRRSAMRVSRVVRRSALAPGR